MKILITNVDMFGLNGRDLHPRADDVGRTGSVVDAFVDHGGDSPDEEILDPLILYTVCIDDPTPGDPIEHRRANGGLAGTLDDPNVRPARFLELAEYEVRTLSETEHRNLTGDTTAGAGLVLGRMIKEINRQ